MGWINLAIPCQQMPPQELSDFLVEKGALAVAIVNTQADDNTRDSWFDDPYYSRLIDPETAVVKAMLVADYQLGSLLAALKKRFDLPQIPEYAIEPLPEQDWVSLTQALTKAIEISPRLHIVPTWHEIEDESIINLRLDPGIAFGSGTHPTTRLCLEWLDRSIHTGQSVLDYGCGSGILGIAAKLLGADTVTAIDIDDSALQATEANARTNQVEIAVYPPDELPSTNYQVVIANILSRPLIELAPAITALVRKNGWLVISGILERQVEQIRQAYDALIHWQEEKRIDEWVLMAGVPRSDR